MVTMFTLRFGFDTMTPDTFTLFDSKNTETQFLHYLSNCHANIKFTVEFEDNNGTIPFLEILIKSHSHTFSVYQLPKEDVYWPVHKMGLLHT